MFILKIIVITFTAVSTSSVTEPPPVSNIDTILEYVDDAFSEIFDSMDNYNEIYDQFLGKLNEAVELLYREGAVVLPTEEKQLNATIEAVNALGNDVANCTVEMKAAYSELVQAFTSAMINLTHENRKLSKEAKTNITTQLPLVKLITEGYFDACIPMSDSPTSEEVQESTVCIDKLKLSTIDEINNLPIKEIKSTTGLYEALFMLTKSDIQTKLKPIQTRIINYLTEMTVCVEKVGNTKKASSTEERNEKFVNVIRKLQNMIKYVQLM